MSAFYLSAAQAFCPAPARLPVAEVRQVVDGDTLRLVDGRRVRMIGLNAPELGKRGQRPEPLAEAARQRLQALVAANGGRVGLRVGREGRDRYGRTLAHVYGRGGINLEAQLLSEGLGYLVAIAPNTSLTQCQQVAELKARNARLGVWRLSPVKPAGQIAKAGFAVVSGQVREVQRNRGGIWIELQGSLVLRIAPDQLGQFDTARLMRLKGQRIEARGWVVDRSRNPSRNSSRKPGQARWMMSITHKAMLGL